MPTKNFYVILGVDPSATATGIRRAFRDLALRYHPDRAGSQGTPFFQSIVEAYDVLSDPERRASYDAGLRHAGATQVPVRRPVVVEPVGAPEPLVPGRLSLFRDFHATQPSVEEVFDRLLRSFTEPWAPKSQRLDALDLEILLSADEAARGGVLPIGVPVFYPCQACHGGGGLDGVRCHRCAGRGLVEEEEEVRLVIPRFVADGTVMRVPLRGLGIHNLYLRVLLRVGAAT